MSWNVNILGKALQRGDRQTQGQPQLKPAPTATPPEHERRRQRVSMVRAQRLEESFDVKRRRPQRQAASREQRPTVVNPVRHAEGGDNEALCLACLACLTVCLLACWPVGDLNIP